jgi:hypothetical protein
MLAGQAFEPYCRNDAVSAHVLHLTNQHCKVQQQHDYIASGWHHLVLHEAHACSTQEEEEGLPGVFKRHTSAAHMQQQHSA